MIPICPDGRMLYKPLADRIWLTRSRCHYLKNKKIKVLRLTSDDVREQLVQVVKALDLTVNAIAPCSRCIRCNAPTTAVPKASVLGKVPDYVWQTQAAFYQCGLCQRIYWPGSHYKRIQETIASILLEQKVSDGTC